jgi:murein DD-endopeptidase MepM/ murein hydrolase activator NlpD
LARGARLGRVVKLTLSLPRPQVRRSGWGVAALFLRDDGALSAGGGAAALRLTPPLPRFGVAPILSQDRLRLVRNERLDEGWLVVDLGARIGSLQWFRGLVTCTALCVGTAMLAPGLAPVSGFVPSAYGPSQSDEAAAQAIAPLALGGDTGRRMVATSSVQVLTGTPERPQVMLDATIGQGDSFGHALSRAGLGDDDVDQVVDLVSDAVKTRDIAAGTVINMTLGRRPSRTVARPLDQLAFRARFDLRLAVRRVDGALTLVREPIAVDNTPLRIQGRVGAGLYLAARAAGAPAKAVEAFIKTLNQRVPIGSVDADDRFDLIVAQRRAATGEVEIGDLLLAGLNHNGRDIRMMRWAEDGKAQWFDSTGTGEQREGMHVPVNSTRVTSKFGMRKHPLLGYTRMHKGIDFGAPYGAPIMAAADGIVRFAGWHGGHGRYVLIKHGDHLMTGYAHMSRMLAKPGAHVTAGQVIGYVGSTGLSTGPHLHYEVYRDGQAINPRSLRFASAMQLTGGDLDKFKAKFADLLAVRPRGEIRHASAAPAGKAPRKA